MINDKNQNQSSGDGSTNIQAQNIYVSGLTASEARQIAMDVYKANIEKLSAEAAEIAVARAENLIEAFTGELLRNQELIPNELKSPGMQLAILNAQRESARSGDKSTEELLVSLLVERSAENQRNLRQIAIEEAITVASKLTENQVDMLTANLMVKEHYFLARTIPSLIWFLSTLANSFKFATRFQSPDVSHLEFTGCLHPSKIKRKSLDLAIRQTYPGLLQKAFTEEDFSAKVPDSHLYRELLVQHPEDPEKFMLNAISTHEINIFFSAKGYSNEKIQPLFNFQIGNSLPDKDFTKKLIDLAPGCEFLFDFGNHELFDLQLTPVGAAVARANFQRKSGRPIAWPYRLRDDGDA